MKWYHYGYIESCKMHDYNYALKEYPRVKWYHYIMVIVVLWAVIFINMEPIK